MSDQVARVYLIDDDADMHHAVRLMLEPRGYEVKCFLTGSSGLEAIRRQPPDVLLLDIMLGSPVEGIELGNRLACDPQTSNIPIVMISSLSRAAAEDLARQIGLERLAADEFLEKPLAPDAVVEAVASAAAHRKAT